MSDPIETDAEFDERDRGGSAWTPERRQAYWDEMARLRAERDAAGIEETHDETGYPLLGGLEALVAERATRSKHD